MKKPLSVYIHIPFCVRKCGYCDFLSFPCGGGERARYVEALCREIEQSPFAGDGYEIRTVFIGGGTPSVLDCEQTERILWRLGQTFGASGEELTAEINPGTVTKEKLLRYRKAGFNRLSIGLQSVHDRELKTLGRIHSFREFEETFFDAREAGFQNINVDLMYGLPGQTKRSFEESLNRVSSLYPEHISAYGLILEEGTPFWETYAGPDGDALPGEEDETAMYEMAVRRLLSCGYDWYEVSNFSRPGFACRHNKVYWERGEYLGFGLGASSMMAGARFRNEEDFASYCAAPGRRKEYHRLTEAEAMEEFMFLGLRLRMGISEQRFCEEFGRTFDQVYGAAADRLLKRGLAERKEGRFRLTERGNLLSNSVLAEFLF